MSNENQTDTVSNEMNEKVELFNQHSASLVSLVERIKTIRANTLMGEKKAKIDALGEVILEEDIKHMAVKIAIINDALNELEA